MSDVTIDVSEEAQEMLIKMAADYAKKQNVPVPTLEKMVATYFVIGLRTSVHFTDAPPTEGYEYGEWVPRNLAFGKNKEPASGQLN